MPYPKDISFTLPGRAEAQAILDRLLAAREPDRRLDDLIHDALSVGVPFSGAYTKSFDEAADLGELVLPGWSLDTQSGRSRHPRDGEPGKHPLLYATYSRPVGAGFKPVSPPFCGQTRGLSVCQALFAALVAEAS